MSDSENKSTPVAPTTGLVLKLTLKKAMPGHTDRELSVPPPLPPLQSPDTAYSLSLLPLLSLSLLRVALIDTHISRWLRVSVVDFMLMASIINTNIR